MGTGALSLCGADKGLLGEQDSGGSLNWEPIRIVSYNKQYNKEIALVPMEAEAEDYIFIIFNLNVFFFFLMSSHRKGIAH